MGAFTRLKFTFSVCTALACLGACVRERENTERLEYAAERLSELMPLVPGKYITYRLDSLVFTEPGNRSEFRRYQVKHLIDTLFKDNLGRTSYRVFRFINDSTASGRWQPDGTHYITPLEGRFEATESNLRSIALVSPVQEGFGWKGNRFMPDAPFGLYFTDMPNWDFVYGPEKPETIGGRVLEGVRMVYQADKKQNALYDRPEVDTLLGYNISAKTGYAKNIGMVYKELTLWENQNMLSITINPSTSDTIRSYRPTRTGFGVRMWMIDHN